VASPTQMTGIESVGRYRNHPIVVVVLSLDGSCRIGQCSRAIFVAFRSFVSVAGATVAPERSYCCRAGSVLLSLGAFRERDDGESIEETKLTDPPSVNKSVR
jgi:hypothetical protein